MKINKLKSTIAVCCLAITSLQAATISNNATTATWSGNSIDVSASDNVNIGEIATKLATGNVTIKADGDVQVDAFTAVSNGTAYTLTIIATGNVTAESFDLHGTDGIVSATTTILAAGNAGHNLEIKADGTAIISGIINTKGGNGSKPTQTGNPFNKDGGAGGGAGFVSIEGQSGVEVAGINAVGGIGGNPSNDIDGWDSHGGKGGNGGKITLTSATGNISTALGETINVSGGNANQTPLNESPGTAGSPGEININAKNDINVGTTIIANAGNTGNCKQCNNAKPGVDAKSITIFSSDGAITIETSITANGGKGASQNQQLAGTDGGKGGNVSIISKFDLIVVSSIVVNGGEPGSAIYSNTPEFSGNGGAGGSIYLKSDSADVHTKILHADGADGSESGSNMNNKGGKGGAGGTIEIVAPNGALIVSDLMTAKGGTGGKSNDDDTCPGNGGDGGSLKLGDICGGIINEANNLPIENYYTVDATIAKGQPGGGLHAKCDQYGGSPGVAGQNQGTQSFPPPKSLTFNLKQPASAIACGSLTITTDLLLDAGDVVPAGAVWQIEDGSGNWIDITLPYDVQYADNGKKIRLKKGCETTNSVVLDLGEVEQVTISEKDGKNQTWSGGEIIIISDKDVPLTWIVNGEEYHGTFPLQIYETTEIVAIVNNGNCPQTYTDTLIITVLWPNAITPYEDGEKAKFVPNISTKITVFNRLGVLIYEGTGGWDGKYKGKPADPGTYFYVLDLPNGRTRKATLEVVKEK